MAVALNGNLHDFGIGEVFQLIGQQQKTGILEVSREGQSLRVAFERGQVVWGEQAGPYEHAGIGDMLVRTGLVTVGRLTELEQEMERSGETLPGQVVASGDLDESEIEEIIDLVTRDSIFALLRWTSGSFHFTARSLSYHRAADHMLPAEQILMDGMRMVDEWRTFEPAATRDEVVFQRKGRFEAFREAHPELQPERLSVAERLFMLVDGRLSRRRVVDLSRLGDFDAGLLLSELLRAGVIEALDPQVVARSRRRPLELNFGPSPLTAVLTVIPFVLLAAVVFLTGARHASSPPQIRLGPEPAALARAAFEDRALRNQVEAFRFARGQWPKDLQQLGLLRAPELLPVPSMAGPQGHPYYYASRRDTFVVLAAEP